MDSPVLGIAMLLAGVGLLFYDWTRNGLPAACGEFNMSCFRAYAQGGLAAWSGVMLGTLGVIYLVGFAVRVFYLALGAERRSG